jgi:hypothetical protein
MRRAAKILHNILTAYCLIGMLPVVFLAALVRPDKPGAGPEWLVTVSGVSFMAWFLSLAYFLVAFCISSRVRQSIVSILSGLTELDERERELTGRAARNTFIMMTAVILGCTLLALPGVTITLLPSNHGALSFSLGIALSVEDFVSVTPAAGGGTRYDLHILPQSFPVPLVCLLLIQVVAFRFFSRPLRRPRND